MFNIKPYGTSNPVTLEWNTKENVVTISCIYKSSGFMMSRYL